jgi:hypothetical protein
MKENTWSQTAGLLLGKISAIWFAVMVAVILFAIPTKLVWWLLSWFWSLF